MKRYSLRRDHEKRGTATNAFRPIRPDKKRAKPEKKRTRPEMIEPAR